MNKSKYYFSKGKPAACPKCGSSRIAQILYGYVIISEALERELKEGKIVLGGCEVTDRDPSWQCTECNIEIFRESLRGILENKEEPSN